MDIINLVSIILDNIPGEECDDEIELFGQYYDVNTTYINLHNTGVSGVIPPEIGCFTNLIELDLEDNFISGNNYICENIPECIENSEGFNYISYYSEEQEDVLLEYQPQNCEECSLSGDVNNDLILDVLDIVMMVDCILIDDCDECSDITNDGETNVLDIVYLVDYILN